LKKNQEYKNLGAVLTASNFYVRKIQLINANFPLAWCMTIVVVTAFIIPIVLKYRIRNTSNFYEVKRDLEEKVVREDYARFKNIYTNIFLSKFNVQNVNWFESCIDPPFNTTKKTREANYQGQDDLLREIYKDLEDADANKYLVSETVSKG
jgi:hypothetical protein